MYERNCDPITEPHQTHQDEIGSWSSNQYDNSTLISVTGAFILDLKTF